MFNLALFGCGNRTRALLNSLIRDHFYRVEALYDVNSAAMEKMRNEYGGTICHSPEELVNLNLVDAILISLSPFAHADALRLAIPTGKPVFVEKPVSFSAAEVLDLARMAEKYHTPVQVGFMRRYCPWNMAALDYQKQHDPGRILSVSATWYHHGETEMLNNLQNDPDNFRLKVSQIPFHCCHALDVLLLHGGNLKRVHTDLIKVIERPYPSPDDVFSTFEFENGAVGGFHYSSMSYFSGISYLFHMENYSIRIHNNITEIARRPDFITSRKGLTDNCVETYNTFCSPTSISFGEKGDPQTTEKIMYDFVRVVRDGMSPKADLQTACRVAGMAEAIELSGTQKGENIEIDSEGCPIQ